MIYFSYNKFVSKFADKEIFFMINAFFISNTFRSKTKLKLAKSQANATQHPEAEFLLFGNYSNSSPMLSFNNNSIISSKQ